MKTTLAILATVGLALSATTATAKSVNVAYDDLNLESAAGQKTLDQRIERASRAACGYTIQGRGNVSFEQSMRTCFERAKAQASEQFAARAEAAAMGG